MSDDRQLLMSAYREFNARNIDAVLAFMHPEVVWANGMEGGHVHGKEAVRAYWTRQFGMLDPHVEPVRVDKIGDGQFLVEVHQVVHDLGGNLLVDTVVYHTYRLHSGLIERMDISLGNPSNDRPVK
jgi:ketosteroid isomerase-like protein